MHEQDDEAEVTYSVKELLSALRDDQTRGFAAITAQLTGKADKTDVARMEGRLDDHARRIGSLEGDQKQRTADRESRRWLIPTVLSAIFTVVVVLQAFNVHL